MIQLQDSQQLHDKPLSAKVVYMPPKDGFGEKNEVKGYKPLQTTATPQTQVQPQTQVAAANQAQAQPQQQAAPQTQVASTPPWKRGAAA